MSNKFLVSYHFMYAYKKKTINAYLILTSGIIIIYLFFNKSTRIRIYYGKLILQKKSTNAHVRCTNINVYELLRSLVPTTYLSCFCWLEQKLFIT